MITCAVCGKQNPDGTQYCEDCGAELTAAPAPAPAAPAEPTPEAATLAPAAEAAPTPEAPAPTPEAPAPAEPAPAPEAPAAAPEAAPAPETAPAEATPAAPAPVPAPAPAPAFRPGKLTVKRFGALSSDVIPLQGPKLTVGRFDASTGPVEIDLSSLPGAENISRRHAEVFFEDGVWKVKDLGSTNGVFIKKAGQTAYSARLVEPTALGNGDELAFGNIVVVFDEA